MSDIINKELRGDDPWYDVSVYRKRYRDFKRSYENVFSKMKVDEYCNDIDEKKSELFKERQKLYDQRREYNKLLRYEARSEHIYDEMIRIANKLNELVPLRSYPPTFKGNLTEEAVLFLSDWHYGMVTDNIWNKFDIDICIQRILKTIFWAKKYIKQNKISKLNIVFLGDIISGAIHTSARIKAEEDTCEQLMHASELLAQVIDELSEDVEIVKFYNCYGNHARTIQNKKDSVDSDNMERLIPWWLEQRLKDNEKIEIIYSDYKEFTTLNVCGYNICCVHGNYDNIKELGLMVNTIFNKKYNSQIDYTVSGDKHHLEEFEKLGIENIMIRSLCGTDDYANTRRLYSRAGQTLMIFNHEYGREATYHIPLD